MKNLIGKKVVVHIAGDTLTVVVKHFCEKTKWIAMETEGAIVWRKLDDFASITEIKE